MMKRILMVAGAAALALSSAPAAASAAGRPATGPAVQRAAKRIEITVISEILNKTTKQVQFYKGEDKTMISVPAGGRWAGSMWIPWVGNGAEMWKSINVIWGGAVHYQVFQDSWSTIDRVRYSKTNSYENSFAVAGSSTGGGEKFLTVQSDGTLYMQNLV